MRAQGYKIYSFANNTLGLNTRNALAGMDPRFSSDLINVEFEKRGGIRKRKGRTRLGSTVAEGSICLGLIQFTPVINGVRNNFQVAVFDDKIYKMDGYDESWDEITGTISLTSSSTNFISFAILNDTLIATNGVDAPWKWDGTGNAAALSISQFSLAKYVIAFKNRLVFFHTTESATLYPYRARWSNVDTLETYSSQDFTDEFKTVDGSIINGVFAFFDDLYVSKDSIDHGLHRMYWTGNASIPFGTVNLGQIGMSGFRAYAQANVNGAGTRILYWGRDNKIRMFDTNVSIPISNNIDPTLSALNPERAQYIPAVNYPALNQVWFAVSNGSSTTNNRVVVFDYLNNAFLMHDNIQANAMAILDDTSDESYLVSGDYNGYTNQHNTGNNDAGGNYNSYYWTAWLDLGDPVLMKKVRWLMFWTEDTGNYNIDVGYNFNFADGNKNTVAKSLSVSENVFPFILPFVLGGTTILPHKVDIMGTGRDRYVRIKFENNNKDEPWTIFRFDILAKAMGYRDII